MASYLSLVDIGKGQLVHSHAGKLPPWTFVDLRLVKTSRETIGSPEIIRFEPHIYGPIRSPQRGRWSTSPSPASRGVRTCTYRLSCPPSSELVVVATTAFDGGRTSFSAVQ
jgi:hypothetical protein